MMLFVNKWCVNTFLICTPFFFLALLHWLGGIYSSELNRNVLRMYIKLQEFPLILGLLNFLLWIGVEFCKTFSLCLLGWSQVLLIWGILLMSFSSLLVCSLLVISLSSFGVRVYRPQNKLGNLFYTNLLKKSWRLILILIKYFYNLSVKPSGFGVFFVGKL